MKQAFAESKIAPLMVSNEQLKEELKAARAQIATLQSALNETVSSTDTKQQVEQAVSVEREQQLAIAAEIQSELHGEIQNHEDTLRSLRDATLRFDITKEALQEEKREHDETRRALQKALQQMSQSGMGPHLRGHNDADRDPTLPPSDLECSHKVAEDRPPRDDRDVPTTGKSDAERKICTDKLEEDQRRDGDILGKEKRSTQTTSKNSRASRGSNASVASVMSPDLTFVRKRMLHSKRALRLDDTASSPTSQPARQSMRTQMKAAIAVQAAARKWMAGRYYKGRFLHNQTDVYEAYTKIYAEYDQLNETLGTCANGDLFTGKRLKPFLALCLVVGAQCHDVGCYVWALDVLKKGLQLLAAAERKCLSLTGSEQLENQISRRLKLLRGSIFNGLPASMMPCSESDWTLVTPSDSMRMV